MPFELTFLFDDAGYAAGARQPPLLLLSRPLDLSPKWDPEADPLPPLYGILKPTSWTPCSALSCIGQVTGGWRVQVVFGYISCQMTALTLAQCQFDRHRAGLLRANGIDTLATATDIVLKSLGPGGSFSKLIPGHELQSMNDQISCLFEAVPALNLPSGPKGPRSNPFLVWI